MIFINFKTYPQATNKNALILARNCQKAQNNISIPLKLLAQASDIAQLKNVVSLPIWAQHIDSVDPGQASGFTTALAVKKVGAIGTMLNHSEHPLSFADLQKAVKLSKEQNLKILICVKNLNEAKKVRSLNSDYIALENPNLIGTSISMVDSQKGQNELREFVKLDIKFPLIGAGISSKQDVQKSIEIGAKGILVSSAIVKADNPQKVIEELALGFK